MKKKKTGGLFCRNIQNRPIFGKCSLPRSPGSATKFKRTSYGFCDISFGTYKNTGLLSLGKGVKSNLPRKQFRGGYFTKSIQPHLPQADISHKLLLNVGSLYIANYSVSASSA